MGMLDDLFGGNQNGTAGYEQANENLQPYSDAGNQSLGALQAYLSNMGSNLGKFNNPADWMYSQINQNPANYYQTLMQGYTETPQSAYEMEQMQRAMNNASAASGMMGSGAFFDNYQKNAYDIVARDQDRYLNNILGVNNQQMNYLQDFRGLENQYLNQNQGIAGMGYNASNQQGQNSINQGKYQDANNPYANMANLAIGAGMTYLNPMPKPKTV